MELEAPLDAFAREQRAGLGALARLSRPGDRDRPEPGGWDPPRDPPRDPPGPGGWDPPPAPPWDAGGQPSAEESGIPDVTFRSRSYPA